MLPIQLLESTIIITRWWCQWWNNEPRLNQSHANIGWLSYYSNGFLALWSDASQTGYNTAASFMMLSSVILKTISAIDCNKMSHASNILSMFASHLSFNLAMSWYKWVAERSIFFKIICLLEKGSIGREFVVSCFIQISGDGA